MFVMLLGAAEILKTAPNSPHEVGTLVGRLSPGSICGDPGFVA